MNIFVLKPEEIAAITGGNHGNPHHILGMHSCLKDVYVNVYLPGAAKVSVISRLDDTEYPMEEIYAEGFFTVKIENSECFPYELKVTRKVWGDEGEIDDVKLVKDPYSFDISVSLNDVMAVVTGNDDVESGFHVKELFGARQTSVNGIDGISFCMNMPGAVRVSVIGDFNGWDGRVNPMRKIDYTDIYELFIPEKLTNARYKFEAKYADGHVDTFSDPYAVAYEIAPGNASMITTLSYNWSDEKYMSERKSDNKYMNIYEVHMPTWKADQDGKAMSYVEFGKKLAAYVKSMGYNYIQLMPLMEYREDYSWGYDTVGMYAPTSRFGSPVDFMTMVDYLHGKGIGVIMDMVTVTDIDCISYWLDAYHLDGVRLEDEELIKAFSRVTGERYKDVYVGLSWDNAATGRLTDYMMLPPTSRGSFAAYTDGLNLCDGENRVWALSHDSVSGGRASYAAKMPGGYEDKYANLRILYGLFMTLPGNKLTFMGQEFGGLSEFDGKSFIDWSTLDFDANSYFQKYVKELNKLYLQKNALWQGELKLIGENEGRLLCFERAGETTKDNLYIVCNFGLSDEHQIPVAVGQSGSYKEILSSDNIKFGGEGHNNKGSRADNDGVILIDAPALSFAVFAMAK